MWNAPTTKQLKKIPKTYATDSIAPADKLIFMHFFIGGCDWYVAEYDGEDLFFGYAILNNDYEMAEWGYFSFNEMKSIKVGFVEIDFDLHWETRRASEVAKIKDSNGC